jgi:hypothetical protein
LVKVLMSKCDLTEEEVMAAYHDFNVANPSGVITMEEFVLSMEVLGQVAACKWFRGLAI